jgi:hypothetical protein
MALKADGTKFSAIEIASDHVFDDRRIELESVVIDWISQLSGSATTSTHR